MNTNQIFLLILSAFVIMLTIFIIYKYYITKIKTEQKIKKILAEAKKQAFSEGTKNVQIAEEKAYLILKLREILYRRYFDCLNIYHSNIKKEESIIKERKKALDDMSKTIIEKTHIISGLDDKLDCLKKEIAFVELDIYASEYGVYKPKYDFITSREYIDKLNDIRWEQKMLISMKQACISETEWTIDSSKREGKKMINRNIKMMLQAFNGECDSSIAIVTYKNINTMKNRLRKSYEKINKLNIVLKCNITQRYYDLKEQELLLVYEYQEKKYQEKEEERIIKQQMREEEQAQKEFERELLRIEKEEVRYKKALNEARLEIGNANKARLKVLEKQIRELKYKLTEIEANKRAISQAQITKSGYIYIISNIGSFGENVYKIGMTRRLVPYDRIRELNGPSVPFLYDVHAMIFSQKAPELELKLHNQLSHYKMNRINKRKEFFNVTLEQIEKCVNINNDSLIEFIHEHPAKEYRLSEKIRKDEKLRV